MSGDGALKGYSVNEFNIDNILSGRALFYLHDATGEEKYLTAAKLLGEQLASHPRTESGVYWHKNVYPWQIWLDGLYMGLPFQIELAQSIGAPKLIDDALSQLKTALHFTYKRETELYVHGYDESGQQAWADPLTGQSRRTLGACLGVAIDGIGRCDRPCWPQALGRVWHCEPDEQPAGENNRASADAHRYVAAGHRHAVSAWNYEESSASAMLSYAILKADRLGVLSGQQKIGEESFDKLVEQAVRPGRSRWPRVRADLPCCRAWRPWRTLSRRHARLLPH